jgi:protease PrsW
MGLLLSFLFGFVPMFLFAAFVNWMDRYEKEPKILLGGAFLWGAIVAAGAAFVINTLLGIGVYLFTNSDTATELTTGSIFAPVIEESLKGFAVLLVFLFFYNKFDSILDGIIYAAITALGFAATENTYYIYQYGYVENGMTGLLAMVFVRVFLVGWQHAFYTAFTGIGLGIARLNKNWIVKLLAVFTGWALAVITHSVHNTLASILPGAAGRVIGTALDWSGWLVMFIFVLYMLSRERKLIENQLREEVALGIISVQQYQTACSAWAQMGARISSVFSGHYRSTDRFYQICGELVHKKQQFIRLGEEKGNSRIIEKLRGELRFLSPQAVG